MWMCWDDFFFFFWLWQILIFPSCFSFVIPIVAILKLTGRELERCSRGNVTASTRLVWWRLIGCGLGQSCTDVNSKSQEQGAQPASKTSRDSVQSLSLKMLFLRCQLGFGVAGSCHHPTVGLVSWLSVKHPNLIPSPTKEVCLASFKLRVIPLNPLIEIIIFPFSLFSSTFSKAEERCLGAWALFRANFSSVRNKNSDNG